MNYLVYMLYYLLTPLTAWTTMLVAGWLHASVYAGVPAFGYGASLLLSVMTLTLWVLIGLVFKGIASVVK